jgi:hypothetical protein
MSRTGRLWLAAGGAVVVVATAITAVVIDIGGSYDPVHNLCSVVDPAPLRQANPLANKLSAGPRSYADSGGEGLMVGAHVLHCAMAYGGAEQVTASSVLVDAAYYPNQRDAALVYNESKRGGITLDGERDDNYYGPELPDPLDQVSVGRIVDARGLGTPEAFCAPMNGDTLLGGSVQVGYVVMARDSNLVLQVAVELTGERMDSTRRRYAAAAITRHVWAALRQ